MENLNVNYKRKLPTPEELKEEIILSEKAKIIKEKRDKEIADVFTGKSNKLILIMKFILIYHISFFSPFY